MKKDKKTKNQHLFEEEDQFTVEEMLIKQKLRDDVNQSKLN